MSSRLLTVAYSLTEAVKTVKAKGGSTRTGAEPLAKLTGPRVSPQTQAPPGIPGVPLQPL